MTRAELPGVLAPPCDAARGALQACDWTEIGASLDRQGYALLPGLLSQAQAGALAAIGRAATRTGDRMDADEERNNRLSDPMAPWRDTLYAHLALIANRWNALLGVDQRYPAPMAQLRTPLAAGAGSNGRAIWSDLQAGQSQALHHHAGGERVFPLQLVLLLSAPAREFTGGELVLVEQRPRRQSRPMVLPLALGDAALITVAQRPCAGSKGYYRVTCRHGVSRVRSGRRFGLEWLFQKPGGLVPCGAIET